MQSLKYFIDKTGDTVYYVTTHMCEDGCESFWICEIILRSYYNVTDALRCEQKRSITHLESEF